MTAELKTVHSFWTPVRTLEKLKSTAKELEKKKGIKISTNQLAIKLIDSGLNRNLDDYLEELEEKERLHGADLASPKHQAAASTTPLSRMENNDDASKG